MKCPSSPLAYSLLLFLICEASPGLGSQDVFTLPPAQLDVAHEHRLQAEGGLQPLRWRVVSGDLPTGIELSTTGALTGTRTSAQPPPTTVRDLFGALRTYFQQPPVFAG